MKWTDRGQDAKKLQFTADGLKTPGTCHSFTPPPPLTLGKALDVLTHGQHPRKHQCR